MNATTIVLILLWTAIFAGMSVAQESCEQTALDGIVAARKEHSEDINALFTELDGIEASYRTCITMDAATEMSIDEQTAIETAVELSASEVVDGGHIVEGLWQFNEERTLSDNCDERKKQETDLFYEDVYYNDRGLLTWDAGNKYSNFTFEYLLTRRYTTSESGNNWVYEREITVATETTMSGRYAAYWQGSKDVWCTINGTFIGELFDTDNACLVSGKANIRTNPSTKSPTKGKIDGQRRAIDKVPGDDDYDWWQLSDDEYVREDVVTASRSCERL